VRRQRPMARQQAGPRRFPVQAEALPPVAALPWLRH